LCLGLFLYEQTDGTDVGKTGGGDVPAAGPLRFPAHFYGDLPPSIRKERMEGLSGVNTASIEQQTGVRIEVLRGGQPDLPKSFSVHDRTSSYNKYKKKAVFLQPTEKYRSRKKERRKLPKNGTAIRKVSIVQ
jgi:hypothetical protein